MFHFQRTVTDWPRAVAMLPPGSLIKAVDQGDILRDAKAINPGVTTMLRHVGGPQSIFWGDLEANKQLARDFFETFIDETFRRDFAEHTDLVQEWNEYVDQWHAGEELQKRLTWAEAVAWVWANEYRTQREYEHIRLALLSWPVGNNVDRRFAEIALRYDCVLSYHPYDKYLGLNQRDPLSWQYHCGRWHFLEQAWGLKPDWVFGEAGPYAGVEDGWRSDKVLGGNRDAYVAAVRRWIGEMKATAAYREGRIKGFALFTTGRTDGGWDDYYTEQPELDMLAAMIREEWTPVSSPPPEPDPPTPARVVDYVDRLTDNTSSPYYPYRTRPLGAIDKIIIHHSVGQPTNPPESINVGHHARGWPRIGYHYYINVDGVGNARIYKTNNLTTHSYHAGDANRSSIGICLAGDFTSAHPSPAQLEAARYLLQWLQQMLGEKALLKHRDVAATACPGNTWAQWWGQLTEEPMPEPDPEHRHYHRTCHLLPQDATLDELRNVLELAYPQRQTVLFSADDAFCKPPEITGRTVYVWDVERVAGSEQALRQWVDTHYAPWPVRSEFRRLSELLPVEFDFLVWPTTQRRVTQRFGVNPADYRQFGLPGHEGVDLASPLGSPYYCVFPGVVIWASDRRRSDGVLSAYGWHVIIDHGGGYTTLYAHARPELPVAVGDRVSAGDVVAYSGNTGNSSGAHLHITVKKSGYQMSGWPPGYIDPTPFVEKFNPAWP